MSVLEIIGYISALFIGLVMGLTGSGGSILSVPVLAYLFGFDEKVSTAYSLFIVGMTAVVGSQKVLKEKQVNFRLILYFGIPAVLGVLLSRRVILPLLPDELFQIFDYVISRRMFVFGLFASLMLIAVYTMFYKSKIELEQTTSKVKFHPLLLTEGMFLGIFMGLVGAGGGFLLVPALMLIARLPIKKSIGTSLVIVCMNSLSGFFLGDFFYIEINWGFLLSFTFLSLIGIIVGGKLVNLVNPEKLKKGFAYFILTMAIFVFLMEFIL